MSDHAADSSHPAGSSADSDLRRDPLLRTVPTIEGFKVLNGVVLYAKVGQGGMGAVYRGRHCTLDVDLAVKCLKPQLAAESPDFVARFEREARLAASLDHQNLVSVRDAQHKDGLHWLVMEFVRGESVRERVQRKGALPEAEALAILFGATSGLAEAHARGIVHRDIKPDNLLVSTEGRVKVADLGLAKAQPGSGHSLSLQSAVMGTPQYMAPEQWDTPDVGPAADVWALGASMWFVLTGEHGVSGQTFAAMARRVQEQDFPSFAGVKGLRPAVVAVLDRCMQRDPGQRFASAKELLAALRPLVAADEGVLADAAAGSNRARLGEVTPPPRQALLRIRAQLDTATTPRDDAAGGSGIGDARTIPSPGATMPMPPPRARRARWPWLVGAVALLVGGGFAAQQAGLFDDEAEWERVQALVQAKALYRDALELLPKADGLDAAIAKLDEALGLIADFPDARQRLALALDKRAELRTEQDVDAAYLDCSRAVELDAANGSAKQRLEELRRKLSARLLFGLRLTSPVEGEVVAGPRIAVRGRVSVPGVTTVEVVLTMAEGADDRPSRKVQAPVVAGEFATVDDAFDAGPVMLGLAAVDGNGVRGGCLPTRAIVPGVRGALGEAPVPGATPARVVVTAAGITMQPVPVRTFKMGSMELAIGRDRDEPQHEVRMEHPFWLGATEVTRRQFHLLMQERPWRRDGDDGGDQLDLPATAVTWAQAVAFCERLTERERDAGRLPAGYVYCLPSEAQWDLAAHGGGYVDYPHGDDRATLGEAAVFGGDAPARVASKRGNAFGLFDLAGNVDEWCADRAVGTTQVTTLLDASGVVEPLSELGGNRIVRGGNFRSPAADCRCAARRALPPETARDDLGFRVALAKR
ncbi:MAG: protein kinase domain-containing protein [Planctomycetota bacterium]